MKAAIYIRVSTEEQVLEGYSLEAQKNRGIEYCDKQGYEVVDFYVDEGISAKDLNRPQAQKLLDDVKKKKFDVVVVYRLNRLSRRLRDLAGIIELFLENKVHLKSTTEELDISSLSGRLMIQLLGVFAEFERGGIAENVVMGLEQRARNGIYGNNHVYGYDYDKTTQQYTINEEEARVVRKAFELQQQGKGIIYICRYFNSKGIKTKNGKPFYLKFFSRMFTSGWYYCGKFEHKPKGRTSFIVDATNIEPIIDYSTFKLTHDIYKSKTAGVRKRENDEKYTFKGKVYCSYCNVLMRTKSRVKSYKDKTYTHEYYDCPNKVILKCDNSKSWNNNTIEKLFLEYLINYSNNKTTTIDKDDIQKQGLYKQISLIEDKISKEENRKKNLQYLLIDETITKTDYNSRLLEISKNISDYRTAIENIKTELEEQENAELADAIKVIAFNLVDVWNELNKLEKREFIVRFIKRIYIDNAGIIKIDFII